MECPFCAGEVPAHVKKCKHCGEWLTKPDSHRLSAEHERETCSSCGKQMIPRIITGPPLINWEGCTHVPKKSICPFCGTTHKKFPVSLGEKVGLVILGVVFIVFALFFFGH